jgi:DNA-binding XRE family transcriptional regulator
VRKTRSERGYSQEGFAAHAGLDRSYYGAIGRGELNPSVETIVKIAAGPRRSRGRGCDASNVRRANYRNLQTITSILIIGLLTGS